VPRFFFDIRDGSKFVADEEGLELPDLDAAEREAAEAAADMGRDKLPGGKLRRVIVEVRDDDGRRLSRPPFRWTLFALSRSLPRGSGERSSASGATHAALLVYPHGQSKMARLESGPSVVGSILESRMVEPHCGNARNGWMTL
jgi:hypothetical protein